MKIDNTNIINEKGAGNFMKFKYILFLHKENC